MEFTDAWLAEDDDALDETCEVEIPVTTQTSYDTYGLGGASETVSIKQELNCMEVPASLSVDYQQGVRIKIPQDLIIDDPSGYVQPQRVVWFQERAFRIGSKVSPVQHTLVRVTLDEINLP